MSSLGEVLGLHQHVSSGPDNEKGVIDRSKPIQECGPSVVPPNLREEACNSDITIDIVINFR